MKKPIWVWIDEMDQPYRQEALTGINLFPLNTRHKPVDSLKSALLQGFIWGCTAQGIKYWNDVYQNYKYQNLLF